MSVTFRQLTTSFGAEVSGVDIAAGVSDADISRIVALFNACSVLVFRGQPMTDAQQIRFSQRFAELGDFPGLEKTVVQNPGAGTPIAVLSNLDEHGAIIPPTDERMVFNSGNEMWHTDSSFKRVPATASMLSGRDVPPSGGDTQFASQRAAYIDLDEELKRRIDDYVAIHDFAYSRSLIDPSVMTEQQKRETPPVPQAVVRANPVNGRKNIYTGAHASHIRGLPLEEGRALIGRLTQFSVQAAYTHTHQWQPQDFVIWDNRCCLHRGRPWDKATYARVMHRTTVMGIGPTAE